MLIVYCTTRSRQIFPDVSSRTVQRDAGTDCRCISWTVQLSANTYCWWFSEHCTTRYWLVFLLLHRILYNYILTYIFEVSSYTVQLDTSSYSWCLTVLYNEKMAYIFYVSSITVQLDPASYFWCVMVYCTTRSRPRISDASSCTVQLLAHIS